MKKNSNKKSVAKLVLSVFMVFGLMFSSVSVPVYARGGHSSGHSSSHSSSSHSSSSSSKSSSSGSTAKSGYSSGSVGSAKSSSGSGSSSSSGSSSASKSSGSGTSVSSTTNHTIVNNYHSSGYSNYYTPGFSFHVWSHPVYYVDDYGVEQTTYAGPSIFGYIFWILVICGLAYLAYYLIRKYNDYKNNR